MNNLVEHIINKEYDSANQIFESEIDVILAKKLNEAKKMVAARMAEQGLSLPSNKLQQRGLVEDELDEMQIGKSSGSSAVAKEVKLKAEPEWTEKNKNLMGYSNPEPRITNADPNKFKSKTPNIPQKNLRGSQDTKKQPFMKNNQIMRYKSQDVALEEETEELDEARVKLVKARVRGGKVQRRKRVSNVPGMTFRSGKLTRMSPAERRRRKLGAKRGKIKRRSKMRQALMKRKRSLRKRAAIGL